tara:strand:+ start:932 stop:1138 length:207 start_codon:yes stop_codon:yes gene_type:complete
MLNEIEDMKEAMCLNLFGRSRNIALAAGQCVKCGQYNLEFRDELSRKEYGISAYCQTCQDGIFGGQED